MFELLKPATAGYPPCETSFSNRVPADSIAADTLSVGEIVLLVSALASVATSLGLTITVL